MKKLWNSFTIAFSMYSKIPMPQSRWTNENMKYTMVFFPWIGLVIGVLSYLWVYVWNYLEKMQIYISEPFRVIVLLLIPVVITGGIHLDGFLNTADARSSWQSKEKRLEILQDSHAGAFAIIACAVYFLFYYGIYTMVDMENIKWIAMGFVLSRSLSALSIVSFQKAKGTGLAAMFSDNAQRTTVKIISIIYIITVAMCMFALGKTCGVITFLAALLAFFNFYKMSYNVFGGITGDLAGYFVQICELVIALAAVLSSLIF